MKKLFFFRKLFLPLFWSLSRLIFFSEFSNKKNFHNQVGKNNFKNYYHLVRILQQIFHFNCFRKNSIFFPTKPIVFFHKNPKLVRFEKSCYFSRIVRQNFFNLEAEMFQVQNPGIAPKTVK